MSGANTRHLLGVGRGLQKVVTAMAEQQQAECKQAWQNSSLRAGAGSLLSHGERCFSEGILKQGKVEDSMRRAARGASNIAEAARQLVSQFTSRDVTGQRPQHEFDSESPRAPGAEEFDRTNVVNEAGDSSSADGDRDDVRRDDRDNDQPGMGAGKMDDPFASGGKRSLHYYCRQHFAVTTRTQLDLHSVRRTQSSGPPKPKMILKPKQVLGPRSREKKVPDSRIERLASYGGLAVGLSAGAIAEVTRRSLGLSQGAPSTGAIFGSSPFLSEANAERIVATLCKVRGAALKLGQMLSIQDNVFISPQLQTIFARVRQGADFMPEWQMKKVLTKELGTDWATKLKSFETRPFAAASIGQVHLATLHDGREVAMKIQYPGIGLSIDSDIDNLMSVLTLANILPKGLYVDNAVLVARKELAWEVDYIREANNCKRFRELMKNDTVFHVPEVIDALTTQQVLTQELIYGEAVDKVADADEDTRYMICENILRLCLKELFEFRFMQTDPNWSNFFYNADTNKICLLDFGACRDFDKRFVDDYMRVIKAATYQDKEGIKHWSEKLGFLTGYETSVMVDAHIDAVMILGEAFSHDGPFDFTGQSTTRRIQNLIPTMLKHRLTPPPEETYSLHRKMSGAFLLCTKLDAKVNCKRMFDDIYAAYRFDA